MKKILAVALFASFCTVATATPIAAPNAFQKFMEVTTGAGKQTVGFGSNGVPTVSPGVPTIHTDGGAPVATGTGSFRNPSGNSVPVTTTARVPGAEVSKAAGRAFARAAASLAGPIGVGLAIYDLANELNFILSRPNSGEIVVSQIVQIGNFGITCGAGATYGYKTGTLSLLSSQCSSSLQAYWRNNGYPTCTITPSVVAPSSVRSTESGNTCGLNGNRTEAAQLLSNNTNTVPSTRQEFIDAVAARSGFPSGSAVNRVIAEDNPVEAEKIKVVSQTTTGPATSIGTSASTSNTTNNTTKVETVTHNHTYQGDVVTTSNTTNTITTNNTTGAVTESTTNISTAAAPVAAPQPEKTIVCGLPDTPACKIDETGTKTDVAELSTKSKTDVDAVKDLAVAEIDKAGSMTAPAWSFSFQFPTGCAPYATGIRGFILNVCPYQPQIHGLLSAIWAAATLFAMIGMVGKTIRGE